MAAPDKKLTDEARSFIVTRLAWRDSPQSIVNQVKEECGVQVTRQTIEGYDPVKMERRGKTVAPKWIELYLATRKAIESGAVEIGISDKFIRLARMERIFHRFMDAGNFVQARETLIEAEKMANGFYAKQRTGLGGFGMMGDEEGGGDEDHHGGYEVVFVRSKEGAPVKPS